MTLDELHFTLPSTYAHWSANDLQIWEERDSTEPKSREQISLSELISTVIRDPGLLPTSQLLIEDVQSCLSAIQADIHKISSHRGTPQSEDISNVIQKESLRTRLNALRTELDQIANQPNNGEFGHEQHLPLRFYFGWEDQSQPQWQRRVLSRVNCLLFSTIMFYHLQSISLYSDIKMLAQIARDQISTSEGAEVSEIQQQAHSKREQWAQNWAQSPGGRRSICHAYDVLASQQNIKERYSIAKEQVDPMSHVALCAAALVISSFCKYYDQGCDLCVTSPIGILEMTRWGNEEKEAWIDMPYVCRPSVQGIQLCRCNSDFLVALFRPHLPDDWRLAEILAPGIFKLPA